MRIFHCNHFVAAVFLPLIAAMSIPSSTASAAEAQPRKVHMAYSAFSAPSLWFLLGKNLGFFQEERLAPEFVLVRGGSLAVKGLMAGNFDYAHNTGVIMDAAIRTRQPLKVIFTAGTIHFWLVAQPEIRAVTDLRGKVIGISSLGSSSDFATREILKRHGLNPLKETTLLQAGGPQERFTALTSKALDATVLTHPFTFKALGMGYRRLAKANEYLRWPAEGLAIREDKAIQDPEEVSGMVRASLKGLRFILAHKEFVIAKMMQMFRLTRDEAADTYEALREESLPSGQLSHEEIVTAIEITKQAANVTEVISPERIFDNRFVKQAEQELRNWKPPIPR